MISLSRESMMLLNSAEWTLLIVVFEATELSEEGSAESRDWLLQAVLKAIINTARRNTICFIISGLLL